VRINCGTCHAGQNRPTGLQLAQMLTPDQISAMAAQQAAQAARQGGPGGGPGGPGGAVGPGGPPPGGGGAPGGAGGQGRGQQAPTVPVDEILTKYMDALGGSAAIAKVQSRVITGTVTSRTAQSTPFTIEEKGAKYRETLQSQPEVLIRGFDGTNGWDKSARASRISTASRCSRRCATPT